MPSGLSWLFNNEQSSDISIKISVDCADRPSAKRLCKERTQPESDETAEYAVRLYGHTAVLASYSTFFRARCSGRWDKGGSGQPPKSCIPEVRLEVVSEAQAEAAERMIKCMYCKELDADLSVDDVLHVMQVSDMFDAQRAAYACIERLVSIGVDKFTATELQAVMAMPHTLRANQQFSKLALEAVNLLVSDLVNLEAAWNDAALREKLVHLPAEAIVELLKKDELVVLSENVVLVAALSWLRGPVGSEADATDRKAVMALVRLLRLTPTFKSLVVAHVPEVKDLLTAEHFTSFLLLLSSSQSRQLKAAQRTAKVPKAWSTARKRSQDTSRTCVVSIKEEELVAAMKRAVVGQKACKVTAKLPNPVYLDGFNIQPSVATKVMENTDETGRTPGRLNIAILVNVVVNGRSLVPEGDEFTRPHLADATCNGHSVFQFSKRMYTNLSSMGSGRSTVITDCNNPLDSIGHFVANGALSVQYMLSNPLGL